METEVKKVKIISMKIKTGDKEIELTMEEAKDLFYELRPLFDKEFPFITQPVIYREIPVYPYPTTYPPLITWGSNSNSNISFSGEVQS